MRDATTGPLINQDATNIRRPANYRGGDKIVQSNFAVDQNIFSYNITIVKIIEFFFNVIKLN